MDAEKITKTIFIFLFIIFVTIYISQSSGYYEYELHKKTELTKEEIDKFEKDVKAGKQIDLENYMNKNIKDYSTTFSKAGSNFSKITSKYIRKGIEELFIFIESLLT